MATEGFGNGTDATMLPHDVGIAPAVCREISGRSIDFDQTACYLVSTRPKYSLANTPFSLFAKTLFRKLRKCPPGNFPGGKARFDFDISNRMKQAVRMTKPPLGRGLGALLGGGIAGSF